MNQLRAYQSSHYYIGSILCTIVALTLIQLVACNSLGRGKDGGLSSAKETSLPVLVLRQQSPQQQQQQQQRQSSSSSSSSSSGSNSNGQSKPDFFLIWLLPYQDYIPKPIMDMIDQQVRPQTEQISQQMVSQVPGGQEFWSQLSQLQSTISNMGGLQSVLGSMPGTGGSSGGSKSNPGTSSGGGGGGGGSSSLSMFGRSR